MISRCRCTPVKARLVSVPYSMDINDAVVYRWQTEGEEFERMIKDAFDVLYAEGEQSARVFAICLHPYLYGQPHRIKYLDRALDYVLGHDKVWQATGAEIADWSVANWFPSCNALNRTSTQEGRAAMSDQIRRFRQGAGYDHPYYEFDPLHKRTPLQWPENKRLALTVFVHIEYMELDPPKDNVMDPRFGGALGSYFPDFQNYSRREFGNRVGVFRVLDLLSRYKIRATCCVNAAIAQRYPYIIEQCLNAGHQIAAHGFSINRMISSKMDESTEQAYIDHVLSALESIVGERPRGWAGQDQGESSRTPQLLAQSGVTHIMDWPHDDEPVRMLTTPSIMSIPYQSEWDDAHLFAVRKVDAWRYPELVESAFDTLIDEGGRMLGLGVHPWIFGQAHRIRYLDQALAKVSSRSDVWYATAEQIADRAAQYR